MSSKECCPPPEGAKKTGSSCTPLPMAEPAPCCPPATADKTDCCPPPQNEGGTCCPPPEQSSCCPPRSPEPCCPAPRGLPQRPGYTLCAYVCAAHPSPVGDVPRVAARLTRRDHLGHWAMRWGIGRETYRVVPGLYALGVPDGDSPVVVTANYKMTFDLVRRDLAGLDAWLLVLDTKGINVWCAAGKGTFGTDELLARLAATRLAEVVKHRRLLLPQYGAVGVAAHTVRQKSGFTVVYGPIRAIDLPAFIAADYQATEGMRSATFTLRERLALTPVEFTILWKEIAWAALVLLVLGGIGREWFSLAAAWTRGGTAWLVALGGVFCGAVLTPLLLPWLPGRAFSLKGALTGGAAGLAVALWQFGTLGLLNALALVLTAGSVASYCAMNFTGSTPFTSPSGVEKEMRRAIPLQIAAQLIAGVLWLWTAF